MNSNQNQSKKINLLILIFIISSLNLITSCGYSKDIKNDIYKDIEPDIINIKNNNQNLKKIEDITPNLVNCIRYKDQKDQINKSFDICLFPYIKQFDLTNHNEEIKFAKKCEEKILGSLEIKRDEIRRILKNKNYKAYLENYPNGINPKISEAVCINWDLSLLYPSTKFSNEVKKDIDKKYRTSDQEKYSLQMTCSKILEKVNYEDPEYLKLHKQLREEYLNNLRKKFKK